MGTFDSILQHVGDSAADLFGGDTDDLLDNVKRAFSDSDDGGAGGGDGDDSAGSWTDTLGGLFGGGSDDGEDGEDGEGGRAWGGFGDLVDRLTGDGDGDSDGDGFFSGVLDKAKSFLPEDLRDEAEALFRGGDGDDLVTGPPSAALRPDADFDAAPRNDAIVAGDDPTYPDDPTFPADAAVTSPVDDGFDAVEVNPAPMDDFQQDIQTADQIDDSFDNMFEGLE